MRQTEIGKARSRRHYASRKDHIKNRVMAYKDALKKEVLSHYSGGLPECRGCGISEVPKLALDHVNDNGTYHRKEIKRPESGIYLWMRRNAFPPIFQVLCHNCNQKKHVERSKHVVSPGSLYKMRIKMEVFSHYSGGVPLCRKCGEADLKVLTIDHINDDGGEHRISSGLGTGYKFYAWLRKSLFPDGFQVLCFNCNLSKEICRP